MKEKRIVLGKTTLTVEEAARMARGLVRDETIMIRVDKQRKKQIESRAKRAGIPVSAYMLAAEDTLAHVTVLKTGSK
jgi:hypothetical protein